MEQEQPEQRNEQQERNQKEQQEENKKEQDPEGGPVYSSLYNKLTIDIFSVQYLLLSMKSAAEVTIMCTFQHTGSKT